MNFKKIIALCFFLPVFAHAGMVNMYNGLSDSGDELFTLTDANNVLDDSNFELLFEYGEFNSTHEFGIFHYDVANTSVSSMLKVFDDANIVGNDSNVVWDLLAHTATSQYGSIDLTLSAGLAFGAYFISDNRTYYSVSNLNFNDEDHFSLYWETNQFVNANLYIQGWDNGSGIDYDEIIVGASDVVPFGAGGDNVEVPEPGTLAIFALGLLGLSLRRKA